MITVGAKGFGFNGGKISEYLNARSILADYKKHPDYYTTTTTVEPTYDFSKLQDQNLIDLSNSFKLNDSALQSIETSWGSLDTFFNDLSADAQANLQPIWENVQNGTASVEDMLKASFGKMPTIVTTSVSDTVTQA